MNKQRAKTLILQMDDAQSETSEPRCDTNDSNLPAVTASLEMLTVNTNLSPSGNKRVLRKRIPKVIPNENLNRRCSLKPKKRTYLDMENQDDIKEYYLDKSLKRGPNTLETIFEEKEDTSENSIYMSAKRYKRMIQFQVKPSDSKLKKRKAKVRKVFGSKISFKRRCASMQMLIEKLNSIRAESPAKIDTEVK